MSRLTHPPEAGAHAHAGERAPGAQNGRGRMLLPLWLARHKRQANGHKVVCDTICRGHECWMVQCESGRRARLRAMPSEKPPGSLANLKSGDVLVSHPTAVREHEISIVPNAPHTTAPTHDTAVNEGCPEAEAKGVDAWLTEDQTHVVKIASHRTRVSRVGTRPASSPHRPASGGAKKKGRPSANIAPPPRDLVVKNGSKTWSALPTKARDGTRSASNWKCLRPTYAALEPTGEPGSSRRAAVAARGSWTACATTS